MSWLSTKVVLYNYNIIDLDFSIVVVVATFILYNVMLGGWEYPHNVGGENALSVHVTLIIMII